MKKELHIGTITSEMQFQCDKPRYNGFACGYGAHKNKRKEMSKYWCRKHH